MASEYEVGVRAFTHVTVEAESRTEARETAKEQVHPGGDWQIDDADAHPLGGTDGE